MNSFIRIATLIFVFYTPLSASSPERLGVDEQMAEVESMFSNLGAFVASLYDPHTGGFWESLEDKKKNQGKPRLESTSRVLRQIERMGAFEELPPSFKQQLIEYYQSFQRPDGWFDDPQEKRLEKNRLGRAMSYATRSLEMLNAKPLYPLPGQDGSLDSADLEHFQSKEQVYAWIDGIDAIRPAWTVGSSVSSQRNAVFNLPQTQQDQIFDWMLTYLEERQATDGFWWDGTPYNRLSGAFKVSMIYDALGKPMPNYNTIYTNVLKTMRTEEASHACFIRNPLSILEVLSQSSPELIDAQARKEIIEISVRNLRDIRSSDGGFKITTNSNKSTTDGTSQAMTARNILRSFAGYPEKLFPGKQQFLEVISKLHHN